MAIVGYEFKKNISFPAIWFFIGLCLFFNFLLVNSGINEYANYVASVACELGINLDNEFNERVRNLGEGLYPVQLRLDTTHVENVFQGYTTGYIAEIYIRDLSLSGMAADLMYRKYERLQYAVDQLYLSGAGNTLYFAGATHTMHSYLFGNIMGFLLIQGTILASLIMLLSLCHENVVKTEMVIYATKVGRKVNIAKPVASLVSGIIAYMILAGFTLAVFFYNNPFICIRNSSVSSGFNYIIDGLAGIRPFVTWHGFSVASYLLAYIFVSLGLVLCFGLMAYIIGLLVRNGYIGFMILALVNAALYDLPWRIFGFTVPYFASNFLPGNLVFRMVMWNFWFTDGGPFTLWAHFETVGVLISLVLLAIFSVIAWKRFTKLAI
ncbi:MAG: hypothetical protein FWC91_10195 [Defluviitaleaceae bacterium]|nr:hypothetical protein [Defluviitaleaceae bacterium]